MKQKITLLILLVLLPAQLFAEDILVFVAASALAPMLVASETYGKISGDKVVVSGAASSTLARQIERGAKAALFLSASVKWMDYLKEKGTIESSTNYLSNQLVLVTNSNNNFTGANWPHDLLKETGSSRIAMGDPTHVPAGVYAKEALVNTKVWGKLKNKIAPAQTVTKALLFVESGISKFGIVYASNLKLSRKIKAIYQFPKESHKPINYPLGLNIKASDSAKKFYDFLFTEKGKKIFKNLGFTTND
ncbi:MAG: molybdate ABC transporter substrate-binding protein [SAR324 cluster bacterium]|nr:molybdate ABC transporter substrate-binding protein [SAR324 cluster bacterium]